MRNFIILVQVFLVVRLMAAPVPGTQQAPDITVDQILERYIEALGGREVLEKLTTRFCTGKETTDLTSRQIPIYEVHQFETYSHVSGKCYYVNHTGASDFVDGFDGEVRWNKNRWAVQIDDKPGRTRFEWLLDPQNALKIKEYFPGLTLIGTDQVRGSTVYVLKPSEQSRVQRELFFDTTSGLLIGIGHNWEIHDYREVDGILFPYRISESRKGGSTTFVFEEVKHNIPVSDSLFAVPSK
jgi:hypothetical protein